ncbi:hypothetical protein [Pseudomonas syringae]|uniref:hypothetical protein n=1 Tax=Pseudomonas syringae TaxID=317 RepID=UPI000E31EA01|nr:hypothetical protein [Pseudomonas syringae]
MTNKPNDVRASRVGLVGKYDEVLKPFAQMMEKELHANSGKGDRPGWLSMPADTCLLEIYYHLGKLQKAVKDGNGDGICEYAADVANLSMMLTDICGALALFAAGQPADQQGEPVAWVECSPTWLKSGGDCATAPRICVGRNGISHLHPAHAQPATAKVDEKAEFELWADRHFASADYSCNYAGVYLKDWMRHSFAAWQARAKLNTPQ